MTGLSRAQGTRLIGRYVRTGRVAPAVSRRPRFAQRYTPADIELLAAVDQAHEGLSGPATRHILQHEFHIYNTPGFERLASISNGHLYNLRQRPRYRECLRHYEKTRPATVSIGERRKPEPRGQPGFLRIDTVHQGDSPERKGVYHINAVDGVTQWEVVLATPRISRCWPRRVMFWRIRCLLRAYCLSSGWECVCRAASARFGDNAACDGAVD